MSAPPAVAVRGLVVRHESRRPVITAVDDVTLDVAAGQTLAIIGESGSGKSTLLRAVAGLHAPARGTVALAAGTRPQVVFQDADLALSPRLPVWKSVAEPLAPGRLRLAPGLRAAAEPLLADVGLSPALAGRRSGELSGGQRQRVTIARALAAGASLVLFDEPVSAQDVSLQSSLLRLLARLQRERQLTYLIVSHDVAAVAAVADRIAVMYAAKLVEEGPAADVLARPRHPYTSALIAAVPRVLASPRRGPRLTLAGEPPDLSRPPRGCRFRSRCGFAVERCASEEPAARGGGHQAACHRSEEIGPLLAAAAAGAAPQQDGSPANQKGEGSER